MWVCSSGWKRRRDRDALAVVDRPVRRDRAQDRLGVGARQVAEPVGDAGAGRPRSRSVCSSRWVPSAEAENTTCSAVNVRVRGRGPLRLGVPRGHLVAAAVPRPDAGHRGHRVDHGAPRLREVEVVLGQRVLGVVPAAGHALAAVPARAASRSGAAEVRVGDLVAVGLARSAEEDPDRGRVPGVAHAHVVGDLLHHLVGGGDDRVVDDAEHPLRLVVVRRQLVAPVGDVAPLRVVVERARAARRACSRRPANRRRRPAPERIRQSLSASIRWMP